MKKKMIGTEGTNRNLTKADIVPMLCIDEDTSMVEEEGLLLGSLITHYKLFENCNIVKLVFHKTGLNLTEFCAIYDCPQEDLFECIIEAMNTVPICVMRAVIRAWADIRFIHNSYLECIEE